MTSPAMTTKADEYEVYQPPAMTSERNMVDDEDYTPSPPCLNHNPMPPNGFSDGDNARDFGAPFGISFSDGYSSDNEYFEQAESEWMKSPARASTSSSIETDLEKVSGKKSGTWLDSKRRNRCLARFENKHIFACNRWGTKDSEAEKYPDLDMRLKPHQHGYLYFVLLAAIQLLWAVLTTWNIVRVWTYQHWLYPLEYITILCVFFFGYLLAFANLFCYLVAFVQTYASRNINDKGPVRKQAEFQMMKPQTARFMIYLNWCWIITGLISSTAALIYLFLKMQSLESTEIAFITYLYTFVPFFVFLGLFLFRNKIQSACHSALYVPNDVEAKHGRFIGKSKITKEEVAAAQRLVGRASTRKKSTRVIGTYWVTSLRNSDIEAGFSETR